MQDELVNFDELTELEDDTVFKLNAHASKVVDFQGENQQAVILVERNLDLTLISRNTYNILDFVSDVGGI